MAVNSKLLAGIMAGPKSEETEEAAPEESMGSGLDVAAEELVAAVEAKDAAGVASALRSAFEVLRAEEA